MITPISNALSAVPQLARRYSIIVSSITIVALNALLFISELDTALPLKLSRFALLGLSFVGLQALPYWIDFALKVANDTKAALTHSQYRLAFITSLKALSTLTNIALLTLGAWAAWIGIQGDIEQQTKIYKDLIPVGTASVAVSLFLLFAYMILNSRALNEAEERDPFEITPLIRSVIDKDTLQELLKTPLNNQEALKEVVVSNLKTQLKYVQGADLALQLLGFFLLFVEKRYTPDSLVSSGINLGVSSLWLGKLAREKWLESSQRSHLSAAVRSEEESSHSLEPLLERSEGRSDSLSAAHAV